MGKYRLSERMEFAVIGDAVNVAARLSTLALPRQILMTRETFNCLMSDVKCNELPPIKVKGKAKKLEIYEIQHE